MKTKKTRKCSFIKIILIVLAVVFLCAAGFEIYKIADRRIDEFNYPLKYTNEVYAYADEYDVPRSVVLAMIKVESGFDADVQSSAGACGLMQLMPDTFTWLASTLGEEVTEKDIFDPGLNIKYGTYYLATLYERLENWENVYAAYNAGLGNVTQWLDNPEYASDGVLTNIPFAETRNHVSKLLFARAKYLELYDIGER